MNMQRCAGGLQLSLFSVGYAVLLASCASGGGYRGGFGPDDNTLNRRGSETVGAGDVNRTVDSQGNATVTLPTDITVRPYTGVNYALHLDTQQRVVLTLADEAWERVLMVGDGYDARYLVPLANSARVGPSNALVTTVLFLDYTSPPCAALFDVWVALQRQYSQDLRLVFKFRPGDTDERSMLASVAAAEAYRQRGVEGFITFSQVLFSRTDDLSMPHLIDAAARAGLSPSAFLRVVRYRTHAAYVSADCMQANAAQIRDVPTAFVNGRRYIGMNEQRWLSTVVEREILLSRARIRAGTRREHLYESVLDPPPELTATRGG
jgi:protein-disulfide isomerase